MEYSKQVMSLGITLFNLLSTESLGLNRNHLTDIDCAQTLALFGHYCPSCPQPELTLDTLVVNVGDLLQLISNDILKSVEHRVLASRLGPRILVACFFWRDTLGGRTRVYRPIEELLAEDNPPKYRGVTMKEYTSYAVRAKGVNGTFLQSLKL
ncbi:hypothetical protein MIMGU_mgv11b019423mg [Erythranthe guttata]|uniref:Isopenicillin N synthase-like Fe(2+) 2OG dioxygenase domain-containing protein n=1 Tax=Erythranthe guttata TaxID=4155 RepID=A0A022RTE4_ERYGU|nr:hypothetical protein MIMGU_mgv11b019423mg [Erythranthe guttata]